jgi:hypothetical protein
MTLLWHEGHFWVFLVITVIIGGGAAYLAGRGQAMKWRPIWMTVVYMLPLGAAVRFFHYALFGGVLTSLHYFITDTAVLILFALLGYRKTMTDKMVSQYPWLYERAGLLSWRAKSAS